MAFIRWKKNPSGNRQAYLIHSYRDENGKPRHKMLAYLGDDPSLSPERITSLRSQFPDIKVDWDKVKVADKPVTDISNLSDAALLRNIRRLRHELGLSQSRMLWRLEEFGMPRCSGPNRDGCGIEIRGWGILERALENDEHQDFYLNPEAEIAPALRKAFLSNK